MSELEALTKTLVQVVGSLQELISKKGNASNSLEPESKLKKSADMTYNQFIKEVLSTRKPTDVHNKKASFSLQEDLQLLYEFSHHNEVTHKTFENIIKQKKSNRSSDTLKTRYDFLQKINEEEMKKIVQWIENQGLDGFLVLDKNEVKIQNKDPKDSDKKRSRPATHEADIKRAGKGSKLKNIPANCKELSEVLKLYSKMVNVPMRVLVEKLDQVSGDLVELDNYIETKDSRLLWTPEEDEIVKKGNGPELQVLRRYRGNGVEVRRKYLGL